MPRSSHFQPAKLPFTTLGGLHGGSSVPCHQLEYAVLSPSDPLPTPRNRVVGEPQRAVYDRDAVNQILDEKAFLCHVGFVRRTALVIPTSFGRHRRNMLYIPARRQPSFCWRNSGFSRAIAVWPFTFTLLGRNGSSRRSAQSLDGTNRSVVILGHRKAG